MANFICISIVQWVWLASVGPAGLWTAVVAINFDDISLRNVLISFSIIHHFAVVLFLTQFLSYTVARTPLSRPVMG